MRSTASNKIVWRNVEAMDRVNIGAFVEFNLGFNAIHKLTRRKLKEKHESTKRRILPMIVVSESKTEETPPEA